MIYLYLVAILSNVSYARQCFKENVSFTEKCRKELMSKGCAGIYKLLTILEVRVCKDVKSEVYPSLIAYVSNLIFITLYVISLLHEKAETFF